MPSPPTQKWSGLSVAPDAEHESARVGCSHLVWGVLGDSMSCANDVRPKEYVNITEQCISCPKIIFP